MENHHAGIKSNLTAPSGNTVSLYSKASDPHSATEFGMQTPIANTSSQSLEHSNFSYNSEVEQSKSISTCSNVVHPNSGRFVESVDSSGTIVTSSYVPAESRVVSTYQHSQAQSAIAESAVPGSSPCWALVEWETSEEEPSSYTVINSSQIVEISCENNQSTEENGHRMRDSGLYTGKLIHVLRGRYIMPAMIVIISEDKQFLETELHELRMMAANNLIAKSVTPSQLYRKQGMATVKNYGRPYQSGAMQSQQNTISTSPENTNSIKRQRCDSGSSGSMMEIESRVSSASAQQAAKEETGVPFNADISYKKAFPPLRQMTARFSRNELEPKQVPPMTFDQQTQTTGLSSDLTVSSDANFVRIVSYLESIMAEQKGYRMESEYNRRLLHELQEKILDQYDMLRNVKTQVAEMKQTSTTQCPESQSKQSSLSDVTIAEIVGEYSPEPGVGTNTMVIDSYETTNNDQIVLSNVTKQDQEWKMQQESKAEERQGSNSNQSWTSANNTRIKIDDLATRSSTTPRHSMEKSPKETSESSMFKEVDNHSETVGLSSDQDRSNSATMVHDLITNDWNDSMQENESNNNQSTVPSTAMIALGSNNTMVSRTVLDNIKWVGYKHATRKILQAVFPREVMATHSLSGRPCPAYAFMAEKPVKGRLDPEKVADVIELITKKFNIDESHVRAVITNKCADENKMLRLKNGTAMQANLNKPVTNRARKRRNKENVN